MTLDEEQIRHIQTTGIDWYGLPLVVDGKWGPKTAWWAGITTLPTLRQSIVQTVLKYKAMGVKEEGGANHGPWVDKFLAPAKLIGEPWCVSFTSYVLREVGMSDWPYHTSAYGLINWAKQTGRVVKTPLPGDLFAFLHDSHAVGFTPGHGGTVLASDSNWIADCDGNVGNAVDVGKRAIQGLTFIRTVDDAAFPLTMPTDLRMLDGSGTR